MEQAPVLLHVFLWSAVAYWAAGWILLWKIPKVRSSYMANGRGNDFRSDMVLQRLGEVSVIIPARNEERNIPLLLDSLVRQDDAPLEIIVVNDQSTDDTAARVEAFVESGIRLIDAGPRPEGWTGKNWSCHRGAEAASGRLLLFLDADTRLLSFDSLRRLVLEQSLTGGMLSVQPYHTVGRLYEQLSGFFNLIAMIGSGAFSCWSRAGEAKGCFGPCILISREDYLRTGGHAAVRANVVDDLALCMLCRRAGIPVSCFGGREVISFRMYPGGVRSLIEGWTKNMALGASLLDVKTLVLLIVWFTGISNAALVLASYASHPAGLVWGLFAGMVYGLYIFQLMLQLRRVGSFHPAAAIFFPLLFTFFAGVFFYSLVRVKIMHSVTWKGRAIQIDRKED